MGSRAWRQWASFIAIPEPSVIPHLRSWWGGQVKRSDVGACSAWPLALWGSERARLGHTRAARRGTAVGPGHHLDRGEGARHAHFGEGLLDAPVVFPADLPLRLGLGGQ